MSELHVSGVLVQASPDSLVQAMQSLASLPGVDVCTSTEDGKIVTVVDRASDTELAEAFNEIRNSDGVLSASLVYHYSDRSSTQDEEVAS